jgi:hypothetical protein
MEALSDDGIPAVVELAIAVVPGYGFLLLHDVLATPKHTKPVGIEPVTEEHLPDFQETEVDAALPLSAAILRLQDRAQLLIVVEVLLHTDKVIAFTSQKLADTNGLASRPVGINMYIADIRGQPVYV